MSSQVTKHRRPNNSHTLVAFSYISAVTPADSPSKFAQNGNTSFLYSGDTGLESWPDLVIPTEVLVGFFSTSWRISV